MDQQEVLNRFFERPDIDALIKEYADRKNLNYGDLTNDTIMEILEELGLMDALLDYMAQPNQHLPLQLQQVDVPSSKKTLKLYLETGRRFKNWPTDSSLKFCLSVAGFGQKFTTPLHPIAETFQLNAQFSFDVDPVDLKIENCIPI